jgi:hypothetical protein
MSLHRALPSAWVALVAVLCAVTSCKAPVVEEIDHFPLRGAHVEVSCSACHGESLANATPTTCAGCHEGTRPANHYEGDCQDCHNEISWEGAVADHRFFPLEFGHSDVPCLDCHLEDDFSAADPTCSSCHARPANHFAGACAGCHTIRDWNDADFDHRDFFPTPHEGVSNCSSCHLAAGSGDYSTFTCIECHEHRRSRMDDKHLGEVSGYVWASPACLDCHPDGRE